VPLNRTTRNLGNYNASRLAFPLDENRSQSPSEKIRTPRIFVTLCGFASILHLPNPPALLVSRKIAEAQRYERMTAAKGYIEAPHSLDSRDKFND